MTNILNKKRKKKGFTLIELVIVLAVLAIIALIAIPNFTKVRNDSLEKADKETANQIRKLTLMAIANEKIKPDTHNYVINFGSDGKITEFKSVNTVPAGSDLADVKTMMKEVKKPQKNGESFYLVKVYNDGDVAVGYSEAAGNDFKGQTLSQ